MAISASLATTAGKADPCRPSTAQIPSTAAGSQQIAKRSKTRRGPGSTVSDRPITATRIGVARRNSLPGQCPRRILDSVGSTLLPRSNLSRFNLRGPAGARLLRQGVLKFTRMAAGRLKDRGHLSRDRTIRNLPRHRGNMKTTRAGTSIAVDRAGQRSICGSQS